MPSSVDKPLHCVGFPVSALEPQWFESEFLPWIGKSESGSILWIVADSCEEVDYLLGRVKSAEHFLNKKCQLVTVENEDPGLLWDELVGGVDREGLIHRSDNESFVLLEGAAGLGENELKLLAPLLDAIAKQSNVTFVGGSTYDCVKDDPTLLGHLGMSVVKAKSFNEIDLKMRVAITEALLVVAESKLDEKFPEGFATELVEASPKSRTELEMWVAHYCDHGTLDEIVVPPDISRANHYPVKILTNDRLRSRYDQLRSLTDRLNVLYHAWRGERLFVPVREFSHPFDGLRPDSWFLGCLSYVACLMFDSTHPGFEVVKKLLALHDGSVVVGAEHRFYRNVRALRTRFQHGLSFASAHDKQTLEQVDQWFIETCGSPRPKSFHWRKACDALLTDWEVCWRRLEEVLFQMPTSPERLSYEEQIIANKRELPRWKWHEAVAVTSDEIAGSKVDVELVVEKNLTTFQGKLKKSVLKAEYLFEEALKIAEDHIIELLRKPPLTPKELIKMGVKPGPEIGVAMGIVQEHFMKNPNIRRDELLTVLTQEVESIRILDGSDDKFPSSES